MTDNHQAPNPEDMGDQLDEEIKETVHDWAENPDQEDYDNLDERVDEKLRRTIAGWVGAEDDADWKAIGGKMDAKTRDAIGKWVGAGEEADWAEISGRMENRVRFNIARLVRAKGAPADEDVEPSPEQASWADIGTKIEQDVRGWVASVVGTEYDDDWNTIGGQFMDHVRTAFDKVTKSEKKAADGDAPYPQSGKIDIEGEDETPDVTSEKPVD
jgi:hypothetical protein